MVQMTLIAAFFCDGVPIILGDIIISRPGRTGATIGVPTIGESTNISPAGSGYSITGLRQKVAVLSDDLALAWAGNVIAARTLVEELRTRLLAGKLTVDSHNAFLKYEAYGITGNRKASLVGFLKDSGRITSFGHNALIFASPVFGNVTMAGSGAAAIQQALLKFPTPLTLLRGDPNALAGAIAKSLIVTGSFLQMESATHDSLRAFYGGGYELASFVEGRFSKIDDVTYIFWYAEIRREEPRVKLYMPPHLLMKVSYKGDSLIIRALRGQRDPKTGKMPLQDSTHLISPVYSIPEEDFDLSNRPAMKSRFLCNYVLVDNPSRKPEILCRVDYDFEGSDIFEFVESLDKPNISFRRDFLEYLISEIVSWVKAENSS